LLSLVDETGASKEQKSILKHSGTSKNNTSIVQLENVDKKSNNERHVQYNVNSTAQEPPISLPTSQSRSHSHFTFHKNNRTQSMSDDSEDSDLSYGDDMLTKSFRHIRRGSINPVPTSDGDLSITLEDSECGDWGDLESEASSTAENDCIYLDYNGTTPIHPMVLDAMVPYFTRHFGNPSSSHAYGQVPRAAVAKARRAISSLLHSRETTVHSPTNTNTTAHNANLSLRQHKAQSNENSIVFTGCGTEADNLAIRLALEFADSSTRTRQTRDSKKKHIVTSNVEHPAIDQALKALQAKGECDVTFVPVNNEGIVSAQDMINAIRPNQTILVTLMLANNESGALQPVRDVSTHCRKHGILFHTDAAQAAGKVSLSLEDDDENNGGGGIGSGVDMVTIVGHKMGAPKGVAALYIRPGCLDDTYRSNLSNDNEINSAGNSNVEHSNSKTNSNSKSGILANKAGVLLLGGGQENGLRAGTENVPYIVGMGCAASLLTSKTRSSIYSRWEKNAMHMEAMRNRLLQNLTESLGEDIVRPNGPADASLRLPNTLSVGLRGVDSAEMLKKIQMHVACSAGSACHAQGGGLSPVLKAMGVPELFARGTLRLSVGPTTRPEDVDKAARFIVDEVRRQIFC